MLPLFNLLRFGKILLLQSSFTSIPTLSRSCIELLKDNNCHLSKNALRSALPGRRTRVWFSLGKRGLGFTHQSAIWQTASCCKDLDSDSSPDYLFGLFISPRRGALDALYSKSNLSWRKDKQRGWKATLPPARPIGSTLEISANFVP